MSRIMAYQYPPSAVSGSEMDVSQASYHPGYTLPSQQQQTSGNTADPRTSHMSLNDSRAPDLALRRSFSTPNAMPFPSATTDDAHAGASGEKKRNKLGYHRTSVACGKIQIMWFPLGTILIFIYIGHCRRRKIRCVPSQSDPHGRCSNCIRLKKDCSFHPVDQQVTPEPRSKTLSLGHGSQRDASASPSPATSNGPHSETSSKRPLSRQVMPAALGSLSHSNNEDDEGASTSDGMWYPRCIMAFTHNIKVLRAAESLASHLILPIMRPHGIPMSLVLQQRRGVTITPPIGNLGLSR
jgi:hypothetical protein